MAAALITHWDALEAATKTLFGALALLGTVMVGPAVQARSLRPAGRSRMPAGCVDRVGITLVARVDVFVVITVLDIAAPGRLVALADVMIAGPITWCCAG